MCSNYVQRDYKFALAPPQSHSILPMKSLVIAEGKKVQRTVALREHTAVAVHIDSNDCRDL